MGAGKPIEHHLELKFLSRLALLEHLHPSAFRFLNRLLEEDNASGLRLSTAANAHLYRGRAFLMYIKIQGTKHDPTAIVLSPTYNNMIMNGAEDHSALLFPREVEKIVLDHRGYSAGWARRYPEHEFELKASAPDAFFDSLFEIVRDIELHFSMQPAKG